VSRESDGQANEGDGNPVPKCLTRSAHPSTHGCAAGEGFFEETAMYDMANLKKIKKLGELAPEAFKSFVAFDEAAFNGSAIPLKYKELMAVAVALTTQCPYCIELHSQKARKAGATEQELAETTLVAAALRAGGAITHGTHTLE
jgi:AhpD family alkylhydroperoxidase